MSTSMPSFVASNSVIILSKVLDANVGGAGGKEDVFGRRGERLSDEQS